MDHYFIDKNKAEFIHIQPNQKTENVYFANEKIDKKEIEQLNVQNSTFSNMGFKETSFQLCEFSFSVFINCYFKKAVCQQVKFQSCIFIACNFEGASFINCDFQYAKFDDCYIAFEAMKNNLPHEKENLNGALCKALSIQCIKAGAIEDYKKYLFEERHASEIHAFRKAFHSNIAYYKKYGFFDGIDGLLSFIRSKISKFLWGYGEKMGVLLRNMLLIIVLYATAYFFHSEQILKVGISKYPVISALFYSACTFFSMNVEIGTLSAEWKVITLSEHILGTVLVSLFAAALFRQINRR